MTSETSPSFPKPPPRRTHAPLYVTRVLRTPAGAASGFVYFVGDTSPGGKPPVYSMPSLRDSHLAAAHAAGNLLPAHHVREVPEGAEFRSAGAAA